MDNKWTLEALDLTKAIEIIPSQDPEKSIRFHLPIPNWLGDDKTPNIKHSNIERVKSKDSPWRFMFENPKDQCLQDVRIDGTAVITFMGVTPDKAKDFLALIAEYVTDINDLSPEQLNDILERSEIELGIDDCYDNPRMEIDKYMHSYENIDTNHDYLGAFLPNPDISTAIYLSGAGAFLDGPTATPQKFDNGAFILFPGQSKNTIEKMSPTDIRNTKNFTTKLVQADVFIDTRTLLDGQGIEVDRLGVQVLTIKSEKTALTNNRAKKP